MPIEKNYYILHYRLLLILLSVFYLAYSFFEWPYILEMFWLGGLNSRAHITKDYFNIFLTIAKIPNLIWFLFYLKIFAALGLLFRPTIRIGAFTLSIVQVVFLNVSDISSPEVKYLNFLLLCLSLIDTKKFSFWGNTKGHYWMYDLKIFNIFGFVTLLSYTVSGYFKFITPNWRSGEYVPYLFTEHHLLRPIFDFFPFENIKPILSFMGYFVIAIEGLAVFFAFHPYSRFIIFVLLVLMQIGILIFLDLAQISIGMLIGHLFLFDLRWLRLPIFKKLIRTKF